MIIYRVFKYSILIMIFIINGPAFAEKTAFEQYSKMAIGTDQFISKNCPQSAAQSSDIRKEFIEAVTGILVDAYQKTGQNLGKDEITVNLVMGSEQYYLNYRKKMITDGLSNTCSKSIKLMKALEDVMPQMADAYWQG